MVVMYVWILIVDIVSAINKEKPFEFIILKNKVVPGKHLFLLLLVVYQEKRKARLLPGFLYNNVKIKNLQGYFAKSREPEGFMYRLIYRQSLIVVARRRIELLLQR